MRKNNLRKVKTVMKKATNISYGVFTLSLMFFIGLGCKSFSTSSPSANTDSSGNYPTKLENPTYPTPTTEQPKTEKADFTVTAEELDKEFTRKGVKDADLEKYANKNIAVTGRVSTLVFDKKGTTQPWVTLYAPGVLHGVSCYFDDDNLEQMKKLKMDKMATVQGFQNDFIVPEVSPRLDHCIVIKTD